MPIRNNSIGRITVFAMFAIAMLAAVTSAAAQTEKVLYSFGNGTDGQNPYAGLIFDANGNLYGTTVAGGAYGLGTVFELTPDSSGWTEKILHTFGKGHDGQKPYGGLIFDSAGNLYGTTYQGGLYGVGTVFELTPGPDGWTETIQHEFDNNGKDGINPYAGLIFDSTGRLYGTTVGGGAYGFGVVFKLKLQPAGAAEVIMHNFQNNGVDGSTPYAPLVMDGAGNFYGTTSLGGKNTQVWCSPPGVFTTGCGTVFELIPITGGWNEKILHNFSDVVNGSASDGAVPLGGVVLDTKGNLYGTTAHNGGGDGTAFELTPTAKGWPETIVQGFCNGCGAGFQPDSGLIFDSAGNLYGTTYYGTGTNCCGTVYELSPEKTGFYPWTQTVLYNFQGGTDGTYPTAGVIFDAAGNIYGTTTTGGLYGDGIVYEVTP
jgi:uncharacterized repeat protein (TIGR03803 family)